MLSYFHKYRLLWITLALIVATFPDIFFAGGSLMVTDHMRFDGVPSKLSLYPPLEMRFKSFADVGGALWQSEPKIPYVQYLLKTGENPYWNPYLGAGSLGPEAMIDILFSPLTFFSALLGASSLAVSFVTLFFLGAGCYCLMKLCLELLGLPFIASTAAAMAYMFNGFHISGLGLNYTQSYLFFPIYLYALLAFIHYGGILRFIGAYLAAALILTLTFIPTTALVMGTATLLGFAYALWEKRSLTTIALVALIPFSALLLTAFIYLPLLDALVLTHEMEKYSERAFYPATINALLSVFTPWHLWPSYRHQLAIFGNPDYPVFAGNTVFHIGVTAGLLVLFSLRKSVPKNLFLVFAWCIAIALLLRIFGVAFFTENYWRFSAYRHTAILHTVLLIGLFAWFVYHKTLWRKPFLLALLCSAFAGVLAVFGIDFYDRAFSAVPIIGRFAAQYTWVVVMVCLPFIVAYGMGAICQGLSIFPTARYYLAFILGLFGYLLALYPLQDFKLSNLTYIPGFLLILFLLYRVCQREQNPLLRHTLPLWLLGLLFAEYWYYANHLHPTREDLYTRPPAYVTYIKEHIGRQRVLNLGQKGLPGDNAAAFQIPDVGIMTMNVPPDYQNFFLQEFLPKEYNYNNVPTFLSALDTGKLDINLASFLGIKYILAPIDWTAWEKVLKAQRFRIVHETPPVRTYENPAPWPRAFVTHQPSSALTIAAVKTGTLRQEHIQEAKITSYKHMEVEIETETDKPGTLVLTDTWYPHWHAQINGKNIPVEKIFSAFRGVAVPKGKSQVVFYYDNPAVTWGLRISAVMIVWTLGLGIFAWSRSGAKR